MNKITNRQFIGQGKERIYQPLNEVIKDKIIKDIPIKKEPYIASEKLAEAVNDALYLRRPLLLEGEPGCGKTRLAYSIAYELGYPLKECYIRSTTRAEDLLYTYDAVQRLYDLQEQKLITFKEDKKDKIRPNIDRQKYLELGKLGEAIALSQNNIPSIVLIDEIDKADIDFPNDLLLVLDRYQFEIKELKNKKCDAFKGQEFEKRKDYLPLIIITSNREKELSKAFLRRCLFYYIDFPSKDDLRKIIISHFQQQISPLFEEALTKFTELREAISWRKKPSTGEFINWLKLLERGEKDEQTNQYKTIIEQELKAKPLAEIPFIHTLVKNQSDYDSLSKKK